MRLCIFDDWKVGVVVDELVHDVTAAVPGAGPSWPPVHVNHLIASWPAGRAAIEAEIERTTPRPLSEVRLGPPVPHPWHLIGIPANYRKHIAEMGAMGSGGRSMRELGFFLKTPGSLVGAGEPVLLPKGSHRRFDHECELGAVIGRTCRNVTIDEALTHVFGYTVLLDLTLRMTDDLREERSMRKSFDTFTPLGPWLVTADEAPDPTDIDLELRVNGELRQHANTRDMIVPLAEQISYISSVMTLYPGDVIATGTPEGVGAIEVGDVLQASLSGIGSLTMTVSETSEVAPVVL